MREKGLYKELHDAVTKGLHAKFKTNTNLHNNQYAHLADLSDTDMEDLPHCETSSNMVVSRSSTLSNTLPQINSGGRACYAG